VGARRTMPGLWWQPHPAIYLDPTYWAELQRRNAISALLGGSVDLNTCRQETAGLSAGGTSGGLLNAAATVPGAAPTASIWPDYLHDCEEHKMNDATGSRRRLRRSGGLTVLVAAVTIGLAACGGGFTQQVASLGPSSSGNGSGNSTGSGNGSGSSTAAGSAGNPTQLVDEWASCMRSHGDPDQSAPAIDANKVIHVTIPRGVPGGIFGYNGQTGSGPGRFCAAYLNAASTALRGGKSAPAGPSQAQELKYAECMRANGVSNYPDPTGSGATSLSNLDPNGPTFENAEKVCYRQTGVAGLGDASSQPGDIVPNLPGNSGSSPNG
jgi:hypothetical protein